MAEIIGFLREDKATHGERLVLKRLKENLPKEFSVYVECPLPGKREVRYPDFIVVTNYGVIVLEVKDWVHINWVDRYGGEISMRGNKNRKVGNPVDQARDIAILLSGELTNIKKDFRHSGKTDIPWGFAVVLPNLPTSTITQLRHAWGKEFVLNLDDLDAPLILSRLKVTLPEYKVRDLRKYELDFIRATINPTVLIEPDDRPPLILDQQQEQIVSEPIKVEVKEAKPAKPAESQAELFAEPQAEEPQPEVHEILDVEARIVQNASIRLVRGVAGSGKTLVMIQRARYLAAQYPEWRIAVLTYNNQLCRHFEAVFKGMSNIKPSTFHSLCRRLMLNSIGWVVPSDAGDWLEERKNDYPIVDALGVRFVGDEIKWIKETGVKSEEAYLQIERKGRGKDGRLTKGPRQEIYRILKDYQSFLDNEGRYDWADLPYIVLEGLNSGEIKSPGYDAILIDEAQDFAPVWIRLITRLLKPEQGVMFLADDPAQSIYRFYSWKEKGVGVVGRTRWLKVPYRNTYEIYQAAYQLIASDPKLQKSLEEEGLLVAPDLSNAAMRHGEKPLIQRFGSFDEEVINIRDRITKLLQDGLDSRQIAVLHRHRSGVKRLEESLRGLDVNINTFHALKGLEFDTVFLSSLQETNVRGGSEDEKSSERRLAYMAMTRARERLYMGYQGRLPLKYLSMQDYVDMIQ